MDTSHSRRWTTRLPLAAAALLVLVSTLTPLAGRAGAAETITRTFSYTGSAQTFTVPDGVSSLTVTLNGGQGGRGGGDSQGQPTPGGYRGVVSGTIDVTGGQEILVAVGGGGGTGTSSRGSAPGGGAGLNPLDGYDGAVGGTAGPAGSSGGGGGSGAATVLRIDDTDIVAAGAGGNGGNGQYLPIVGRRAEETHTPRPDATSTNGQAGKNTASACSPGFNCDGGASGAGGGGAQGGEQGDVQYGGATATEYFGFGGFPGSNDTAGNAGLAALYEYYAGNSAHGSITISYDNGTPGAPRSLSGTPASGEVDLEWLAPLSGGAAAITDYVVQYATSANGSYTTFDDGASTSTSTTVTGLTNGTTYWFKVAAVNSYGTGPSSATMASGVVPSDVPDAPTIDSVSPVDAGLVLEVTPGPSDSPIQSYEYRLDGGAWTPATEEDDRVTIAGLLNGRNYSVELRARNAVGASEASDPADGTPRAVPSAPSALVATGGPAEVQVAWRAPEADNGAPVTDYVVQYAASSGGPFSTFADGDGTATTSLVSDLLNGTTYHFRVAAVNAAGTGPASAIASATPSTTPDAAVISSLEGADGSLVVDLGASSDGGAALVRYEYRLDGGSWISTGSTLEPFTIGGLTNGTEYEVEVRAVNGNGVGPSSAPKSATPRSAPAAPAISAVALDTGAVAVTFTLGSNGGSPVTNVEYSIDGGDTWTTRSPAATTSPVSIGGLVGGQTYEVRLRAVNAYGPGAPSNASTVTAKGTPEAPSITSLLAGDRTLSVAVVAGPNGGSAITNYEYSIDGGDTWTTRSPASAASPVVITGLTNGTTYPVRVRAANAAGAGDASSIDEGTPRTTPGAPVIDSETIVGIGGELDVEFSAPSSDGGSAITTYQYSTDAGATWRTRGTGTTSSPLRISTLSSDASTPLVGGDTYPVEIRAVNAAGPGAASAVADGITTTVPGAPLIDDVEVSDGSARVTFDAPSNGGSTIERYEYRLDGGSWTDTGSSSGVVLIGGLANAGTYEIELRAVNSVGAGPASSPRTISVRTTPAAPEVESVLAGDGTLSVSFVAGDDGGDTIVSYDYSTDGGTTWRSTGGGTSSPTQLSTVSASGSPLANGTLYPVQLRAVNSVGAGAASVTTLVAPQGTPDAPQNLTLQPGDRRLVVGVDLGSDGGSAISGLEYRLDGGTWVDAGSLSAPFTIAGLTNGTSYQVEVRALSALGAGAASAAAQGTPSTVSSAPRDVVATVEDGATDVTWAAPLSDGGAAVVAYVVTLFDQPTGGVPQASCTTEGATACDVTPLDNGTTYYVGVVALNAAGASPSSSPRVAVTPLGRPTVSIAAVNPGASDLLVGVDSDDNGAPISTYEYRLDGGAWTSAGTSSEPFGISGLTTGTTYVVEVRARNSVGAGAASAPVAATPRTVPGAPRSVVATGTDASAQLSWTPPSSDGGAAISDYVVQYATSASGPFTTFADGTSANTSATVSGLVNGSEYVFRVAAVNAAGTGSSSPLASTTPLAAPGAPNLTSLSVGSQYVQAAFTAPSSNGGSSITGYQYQLNGGEWRNASTSTSPITIAGLTNGQSYTVALRAVNAVGGGTASNTRTATPYGLPGAVPGFLASPASGSVQLDWDAANPNGSTITAYNIIRWSSRTEGSIVASYQTTNTSFTVNGLGNGTYWFTIEATNAAGTGARSAPRTGATVGGTVPAAPTISDLVVEDGSVELSWAAGSAGSSAIKGYVLQQDVDGERSTLVNSATAGTSTAAQLIDPGAPFSLRLALRSDAGIGAFTTVRPPIAGAATADAVTARSATVSGSINANDRDSVAVVELATDVDDLGTDSADVQPVTPAAVDGTTPTEVAAELTGLEPGTTHHARLVVMSVDGVARGATTSFTTAAAIGTTGLDSVYDGEPAELSTTTEPEGLEVTRSFAGIGRTVYGPSSTPPTDVGTYLVTTEVVGDVLDGVAVEELTIRARQLTAAVVAQDRDHDGGTAVELDVTLDGVIDGDDVAIQGLSASLPDPGAGSGRTVEITVPSEPLSGADAYNYVVEVPATTTVTIRRAVQRVAFSSTPPSPFRIGDRYTPRVGSDRDLAVALALSSDSEDASSVPCRLDGDTLHAVGVGTCVLIATQEGDDDVQPAMAVAQFVTVLGAVVPEPTEPPPSTPAPTSPGNPGAGDPSDAGSAPSGGVAGDGGVAGEGSGPSDSGVSGQDASGPGGDGASGDRPGDGSEGAAAGAAAAADGGPGDDERREERSADGGDATDDGGSGLGDEVAGVSQSRGLFGSLTHSMGEHPLWWVLAAVVLAIGGWWFVAARRREDEQETSGVDVG